MWATGREWELERENVKQLKKQQCKLHHFHWWNWWSETYLFISSHQVSGKLAGFFSLTVNPCLLNHMLETVCHTDIFILLAHALAHHACLGASVSGGESEDHKGMQNWESVEAGSWFSLAPFPRGLYFHNTLVSYAFQTYFPVCFSVCHVHRLWFP